MKQSSHSLVDGVGTEVNRKNGHCDSHGDYISICRKHFGSRVVWSNCPVCLEATKRQEAESKASSHSLLESIGIGQRFFNSSVANYIPRSASQEFAKRSISRYGQAFKSITNGAGIVMCGATGTGKTHLACALVHGLSLSGLKVRVMNSLDVVRFVRRAYSDKTISEESQIEYLANLDLLVIDEVGVQMGSDNELIILFDVINRRYSRVKPTVVVSNMSPDEVAEFLTLRTYRRILGEGLVLDIEEGKL